MQERLQRLVAMLEAGLFDRADVDALVAVMQHDPGDLVPSMSGRVCQAAFLLVQNGLAHEAEKIATGALHWSLRHEPDDVQGHEVWASYVQGAREVLGTKGTTEDVLYEARRAAVPAARQPPANTPPPPVLEGVRRILARDLHVDPATITPQASLDGFGGRKGLMVAVFSIEDLYDVRIPSERYAELHTIGELVDALETQRQARGSARAAAWKHAGLLDKVRAVLAEYVHVPAERITPDANLEHDLGMGQGPLTEFFFDIEDEFDVTLGEDLTDFRTVKDVLEAVEGSR